MAKKDLRTYHRRSVTRESGYHTCNDTTGGECIIIHAERYECKNKTVKFTFFRSSVDVVELFEKGLSIIAFGGYIYSKKKAVISLNMSYEYEDENYTFSNNRTQTIESDTWLNIGIHAEQPINKDSQLNNIVVTMTIYSQQNNILDFIAFDFDIVSKEEFQDTSCTKSFYQKTSMHVPYLYYLRTDLPFNKYLTSGQKLKQGKRVIAKSCNRCGRYLPINIDDELKTLSFSLHCKKRAPCIHSTFKAYKIQNHSDLKKSDFKNLSIDDDKIISYYGHQLECKACKKFFVNAPLNPQRNAQQFKEDGLRRRAIEVLVNTLLNKNLIHFEFEHKNKEEFSQYIWKKFNKRCFKCGPNSKPIALEDMALDHTMPLAYLYRLDETATCLCHSHNSQKSDHFPVDYYTENELIRLSKYTGLSLETLHKKEVNQQVLNLLIKDIVWFYDDFLMNPEYQKVRDGILTADKINDSLRRIISTKADLIEIYRKKTGYKPKSITFK